MPGFSRILSLISALTFGAALCVAPCVLHAEAAMANGHRHEHRAEAPQETGFLNRKVTVHGVTYRFQIYIPEEFRRDEKTQWPMMLFLHGRGERGSEGMWHTQVGLPQAVRDHPERWPMLIVMPQCPLGHFWTDPVMQQMAMAALDQEVAEFHTDPDRTYLSGLSMGGYGAWELMRQNPKRWAAMVVAAGGVFWSYSPERWKQVSTLPGEYARALGKTSVWMFHGSEDNIVIPKQSELMFEAIKANGGRERLWIYQGLSHDCWTRAYNEPDLPRWILAHRLDSKPEKDLKPYTERTMVPQHPAAIKLPLPLQEAILGDYVDSGGHVAETLYKQGDLYFEKNSWGEVYEIAPESPEVFYFPNGSFFSRLLIERNNQGRVTGLTYRTDRTEEHWEKRIATGAK